MFRKAPSDADEEEKGIKEDETEDEAEDEVEEEVEELGGSNGGGGPRSRRGLFTIVPSASDSAASAASAAKICLFDLLRGPVIIPRKAIERCNNGGCVSFELTKIVSKRKIPELNRAQVSARRW